MAKLAFGPIGVVVGRPGDEDVFLDAATVLEALGYATIWLAGPSISGFEQVRNIVAATRNVPIAGGVISADEFDAAEVASWYAELEATHPRRFIVGLGGAHGPKPLQTVSSYLDALESFSRPLVACLQFRGDADGDFDSSRCEWRMCTSGLP
jgi:alkanesulfonate monooxygenase SsuD/methylene tetrahydromethanopterin reductase-like flavin-dependent oxidoreductase (luciferase family)